METPPRKARLFFETAVRPPHVTFDDGKGQRRNVSWFHYVETRWLYTEEADALNLVIGNALVSILGHNLAPLFLAIEERTLLRIRAQPDLALRPECEPDSFATGILFFEPPKSGKGGGDQLDLSLDRLVHG